MKYTVIVNEKVLKEISKVPENYKTKIKFFIANLADSYRPEGYDILKLKGYEKSFRCRIGIYRVIYDVQANELVVEVIQVGHRKDAYK